MMELCAPNAYCLYTELRRVSTLILTMGLANLKSIFFAMYDFNIFGIIGNLIYLI